MAALQTSFLPAKLLLQGPVLQKGRTNESNVHETHCVSAAQCKTRASEVSADAAQAAAGICIEDSTRCLQLSRRSALAVTVAGLSATLIDSDAPAFAKALTSITVGSYLPKAGEANFVVYTPNEKDTPALRAGNVAPYSFWLPPTWTQARIANIQSGNYCQPKCAEPWIEVKFEDPRQGTLQVVASPMVRLTNKPSQKIEDIGSPDKIISALGPFVTGDSFDPEELVESSVRKVGSQTYYDYVLETPYARSGTHNLASATAKGNTVLLLVISASDSQWSENEKTLRKLINTFSV